jgi:hypothetical protein
MRTLLALAILPVLASAGPGQEGAFESPEFGVRLKIPAGWTVGSAAKPEILKLSLPGDHPFRPEILLHNLAFTEQHVTLGQYREKFRQYMQVQLAESRILDDQNLTVGGKPALLFTAHYKRGELPAVYLKALVELSPSRLLSFECVAPRALEESVRKAADALLASVEFFPHAPPDGTAEGVKRFAENIAKLPPTAAGAESKLDLEYSVGDRNVGFYAQEVKAATRDGASGIEVSTVDVIDLGAEGRLEKRSKVFLSDDLAKQSAEVQVVHRSKERREQSYTATLVLDGTDVAVERRINGEKKSDKLKVPERTVLWEGLEALQVRLLAGGKGSLVSVPVLPAFDNEVGHLKLEHRGELDVKGRTSGIVKVTELAVAREDGVIITYQYDPDRKLIRRTVGGGNVILQAKK